MTRRPQFLAAAKGAYRAHGAVVVQVRNRQDGDQTVHIGFTATRKIGGAVVRNRAKRRLREAARALLPSFGRPGCDYVFVARDGTPGRDWGRLLDDVKSALIRLAADLPAASPAVSTDDAPPSPSALV
ncbi:ribonuclease P protein component [Caulobacter sp. NIBR1757]|uniref:ribonuclease P protein component n=1 Tax=Caulobacter sp. NIBR1757 TaxID=3016000 RepID=UPI0027A604C1|nr:Ribonuclease P protein component [Caulobacter sp. NIBR1757]